MPRTRGVLECLLEGLVVVFIGPPPRAHRVSPRLAAFIGSPSGGLWGPFWAHLVTRFTARSPAISDFKDTILHESQPANHQTTMPIPFSRNHESKKCCGSCCCPFLMTRFTTSSPPAISDFKDTNLHESQPANHQPAISIFTAVIDDMIS